MTALVEFANNESLATVAQQSWTPWNSTHSTSLPSTMYDNRSRHLEASRGRNAEKQKLAETTEFDVDSPRTVMTVAETGVTNPDSPNHSDIDAKDLPNLHDLVVKNKSKSAADGIEQKFEEEYATLRESELIEPLLHEDNRLLLVNVKYKALKELHDKQRQCFWVEQEVPAHEDLESYNALNDQEKRLVKAVLRFFIVADFLVLKNIEKNLQKVKIHEAKMFYAFQNSMEWTHVKMYSEFPKVFFQDDPKTLALFDTTTTYDQNELDFNNKVSSIKMKWAERWFENDKDNTPVSVVITAFACMEGIFFSSAFLVVYYFKHQNKLTNMAMANEFIQRDETLHTMFAAELVKCFADRPSEALTKAIVESAVEAEIEFASMLFDVNLPGFSKEVMVNYVKICANRLLHLLGFTPLYVTQPEPDFMLAFGFQNKHDFFARQGTEYQHAVTSVQAVHENNGGDDLFLQDGYESDF